MQTYRVTTSSGGVYMVQFKPDYFPHGSRFSALMENDAQCLFAPGNPFYPVIGFTERLNSEPFTYEMMRTRRRSLSLGSMKEGKRIVMSKRDPNEPGLTVLLSKPITQIKRPKEDNVGLRVQF